MTGNSVVSTLIELERSRGERRSVDVFAPVEAPKLNSVHSGQQLKLDKEIHPLDFLIGQGRRDLLAFPNSPNGELPANQGLCAKP